MKKTIGLSDFRNEFQAYNRDDFSYEGLEVLFNYLEMLEEDCGIELELDVISLCCDYSQVTIAEALENYGLSYADDLEDNTTVIYIDDLEDYRDINNPDNLNCRIIIQNY